MRAPNLRPSCRPLRTQLQCTVFATLLLLAGCATSRGSGPDYLATEFETFQGLRAAPAELREGGERLDIFLGIPAEPPEGPASLVEAEKRFADVLYCLAENPNEDPLPEAAELLNEAPPGKPIYLYGRRVQGKYRYWWGGLDCLASAAAIWHTRAGGYVYLDLGYSTPYWQWKFIRKALQKAVEEGVDKGAGAILP